MKNPDAKNQTFGGKTVLLGDECRQILPVIPQGNRADTVLASISQLYLWESCHKFSKKTNMRVNQTEKEFYDWVLKVREDNPPTAATNEYDEHHEQMVIIDEELVNEINDCPLKPVVETAYGYLKGLKAFHTYDTDRAILTPRNEKVDEISAYISSHTDGESREYFSSDSFEISETHSEQNDTLYSAEYLNSLEFPGFSSYKLTLKIGAPIMLMRNLNQKGGLYNSTRLILT